MFSSWVEVYYFLKEKKRDHEKKFLICHLKGHTPDFKQGLESEGRFSGNLQVSRFIIFNRCFAGFQRGHIPSHFRIVLASPVI